MDDSASKKMIDDTYAGLSRYADELYEFVLQYNDYMYRAQDYGNGDFIKMVEVHTLTMIEDNPGVTVSELAKLWRRTKGTVSVNVSALEKKGYIYRQKEGGNDKVVHLYATPAGVELSTIHKAYDNLDIVQTQSELLKHCTRDELDGFYKVVHTYLALLAEE